MPAASHAPHEDQNRWLLPRLAPGGGGANPLEQYGLRVLRHQLQSSDVSLSEKPAAAAQNGVNLGAARRQDTNDISRPQRRHIETEQFRSFGMSKTEH